MHFEVGPNLNSFSHSKDTFQAVIYVKLCANDVRYSRILLLVVLNHLPQSLCGQEGKRNSYHPHIFKLAIGTRL